MIHTKRCHTPIDFAKALCITKDYIQWLDLDLSFQNVDQELSDFPAMYGPPDGLFLLAFDGRRLAGGIGLRTLGSGICEMKRLFVYDAFKGAGVGRRLCEDLIARAKTLGYRRMRLDTLGRMKAAIGLYEALGFVDIAPYRFNPDPTTRYLELVL